MTDLKIAEYYGVSPATLRNYKKGTAEKQRLYAAMRAYAEKEIPTNILEDKKITNTNLIEKYTPLEELTEINRLIDTQISLANRSQELINKLARTTFEK